MRYVTVYALNDRDDALKATEALASVKPLLPAGVTANVFATGSAEEKESRRTRSWAFGQLSLVLDFEDQGENAFTYDDFRKSEACAELKRRTKGLFSSETSTNYYLK